MLKYQNHFYIPVNHVACMINETRIGYLGQVHPEVMQKMDIKSTAYLFEINLDLLVKQIKQRI